MVLYIPHKGLYLPHKGVYTPQKGVYLPEEGLYALQKGASVPQKAVLFEVNSFLLHEFTLFCSSGSLRKPETNYFQVEITP